MTRETWTIDTTHSNISFSVRHMVIAKVRGSFTRWSGTISFDEHDAAAATAEVIIETASIDTHDRTRDDHLRSPDFLDAQRHPDIRFRTTHVALSGEAFRVTGELTIRGITREIALEVRYLGRVTDPWGGERIAFEGKTTIDRRDFSMVWNTAVETAGLLVGDKVEITLEIEAVKVAEE